MTSSAVSEDNLRVDPSKGHYDMNERFGSDRRFPQQEALDQLRETKGEKNRLTVSMLCNSTDEEVTSHEEFGWGRKSAKEKCSEAFNRLHNESTLDANDPIQNPNHIVNIQVNQSKRNLGIPSNQIRNLCSVNNFDIQKQLRIHLANPNFPLFMSSLDGSTGKTAVNEKKCTECGITVTPSWRRSKAGELLCNACGLCERINNRPRNVKIDDEGNVVRKLLRRNSTEGNEKKCANCQTRNTPLWRKINRIYHCNACAIFYRSNNYHRPMSNVNIQQIDKLDFP